MNQTTGGHLTLTQHRKLAISFRDKALLRIFQIALSSLRQLLASSPSTTDGTVVHACKWSEVYGWDVQALYE